MHVKNRRVYDEAFREGAVALVERSDRSIRDVAAGLGMPAGTLGHWYTSAQMAKKKKPKARTPEEALKTLADGEAPAEKIARLELEIKALRKKNEELEMDRAILKKAAAFFAKESE